MTTQTTVTILATALTLLGFAGAALAECGGKYRPASNESAQEKILKDQKSVGS